MKSLVVFNEDGSLIDHARVHLKLYQMFPSDTASREQAFLLLEHERERWLASEPGIYQPSNLVHAVIQATSKLDGQRGTCGLVALAMFALKYLGYEPSLERAAAMVSGFVEDGTGIDLVQSFKDGVREVHKPISNDVATIQKYFRSNRPAAHLIAAEMTCSFEHEPKLMFDWDEKENEEFVATAYYFQEILRDVRNFDQWGMWEVAPPPNGIQFKYDPILPTGEAFLNFVGVWLKREGIYPEED